MAKKNGGKDNNETTAAPAPEDQTTPSKKAGEDTPPIELKREDMAHVQRGNILSEIGKAARERRDQELRDNNMEVVDTSKPVDEDAAAAAADDAADAIAAAPVTTVTTTPPAGDATPPAGSGEPAQVKRKYVIDGQTVEYTDAEIAELVTTGRQQLAEATRKLSAAPATPAPVVPTPSQPAAPSAADAEAGNRRKETIATLTKTLMYGNEEDVASALEKILPNGGDAARAVSDQTRGMSVEQVQAYVGNYIDQRTAFLDAKAMLERPADQGGYGDIWSEPMFQRMFFDRENELRKAGDNRPYKELYTAIGNEIREFVTKIRGGAAPATTIPPALPNRETRKASAPAVLRGGTGTVPITPTESKPKTREEVLDGIRSRRGQQRI